MQRILARSLDLLYSGTSSPSGLQTDCDYMLIIKTFESQIVAWREQWLIFGAFWNGEFFHSISSAIIESPLSRRTFTFG